MVDSLGENSLGEDSLEEGIALGEVAGTLLQSDQYVKYDCRRGRTYEVEDLRAVGADSHRRKEDTT